MRTSKVRNFAARQLGGPSPETLLQIRDLIDEQLAETIVTSSDTPGARKVPEQG